MPIPKFSDMFSAVLEHLKDHEQLKTREFEKPLGERFHLSEQELQVEYESGNGYIFNDRISWCLSALYRCGLLDKPGRGTYKLSQKGRELLLMGGDTNALAWNRYDDYKRSQNGDLENRNDQDYLNNTGITKTPTELLNLSAKQIKDAIMDDILGTILKKKSYEFEKLVVQLLQKMGYGGEIEGSGTVTSKTNDKGIDGIIKEDVLGFGRIHIQAKRYSPSSTIGREDIQRFIGALTTCNANKGIFITTSSFKPTAIDCINNLSGNVKVILIDGRKLAELIYEYGLGMQVEYTITIKKIDSDYWSNLEDDVTDADNALKMENS